MNPLLHIIKNIIINLPRNQTISKNLKKSKSCTKKNKGSRCLCGGQIGQRNGAACRGLRCNTGGLRIEGARGLGEPGHCFKSFYPEYGGVGAPPGSGWETIRSTKYAFVARRADGTLFGWGGGSEEVDAGAGSLDRCMRDPEGARELGHWAGCRD